MEGAEIALREAERLDEYESRVVQALREMFEWQEERLRAYAEGRLPSRVVCARAGPDAVLCTCAEGTSCGCTGCGESQAKQYDACTRVLANFAAVREARCCADVRSAASLCALLEKKYGLSRALGILGCVESVFNKKIARWCK